MAGQQSRENGKKGGRPRGFAALAAERLREKVAKELEEEYEQLWRPQIDKAKKGDTNAFKELRDFAFGKPRQNVGLDGGEDGEPVAIEVSDLKSLPDGELERIAARGE